MRGRKKGFKHSDETKEKIKLSRAKFFLEGGVCINGMKGKKHSSETIAKLSALHKELGSNKNFGDTNGKNNGSWRGGKEHTKQTRQIYVLKHPWLEPYYGTKSRARINKIPHEISVKEFEEWYKLVGKICVYCHQDISVKTKNRMKNASIDRKINELGYTLNNICMACNRCNTVKGNVFTYSQMLEIGAKYLTIMETVTSV